VAVPWTTVGLADWGFAGGMRVRWASTQVVFPTCFPTTCRATERVQFSIVPQHRQGLPRNNAIASDVYAGIDRLLQNAAITERQRQIRRHRFGELRLGALGEQVGVRLADFLGEGDERQLLPRVEQVAPAGEPVEWT
jgi:hypothetical protein